MTRAGAKTRSDGLTFVGLLSLIPLLIFLPVIFLNWVGNLVFCLSYLNISRRREYRADAFADTLSFKQGMLETLEIINNQSVVDKFFW